MIIYVLNVIIFVAFGCLATEASTPHPLRIGILRHITIEEAEQLSIDAYAEKLILEAARKRGHIIEFVNPLKPLEAYPNYYYDAIISRAEIDSFADDITDAYLRTLHYFETLNIPVINGADATINAQDKFRTLMLAQKAGLTVPATFIVYTFQAIKDLIRDEKVCFPFFIKKPYGGWGKGVFLVGDEQELYPLLHEKFQGGEPILIEERIYVETDKFGNVKDMRMWVVRDAHTDKARFVGGAYRIAADGHSLTNVSAGGSVAAIDMSYPEDLVLFAQHALESIGGDVAGIDVARDKHGRLYLLEINISFYTSKIVADLIGVNIWELVMDLVESRVAREGQ